MVCMKSELLFISSMLWQKASHSISSRVRLRQVLSGCDYSTLAGGKGTTHRYVSFVMCILDFLLYSPARYLHCGGRSSELRPLLALRIVQQRTYRTGEKDAGISSLFSCRIGRTPAWGGHAPPLVRACSRMRARSLRSL